MIIFLNAIRNLLQNLMSQVITVVTIIVLELFRFHRNFVLGVLSVFVQGLSCFWGIVAECRWRLDSTRIGLNHIMC